MKTEGLRVLVTGGASGIGLAIARRLAVANTVAIAGRDATRLAAAVAETPTLRVYRLDVGDEVSARSVLADVVADLGGLDVLVNSAGVMKSYSVDDPNAAELAARDVEVNFLGTLRMTRLALPLLRRSESPAVVLISSVVAIAAAPGYAVYSATKAAVHSLARSLRRELSGQIPVFDVLPTWVDTEPARGIDVSKLAPDAVADALLAGLRRDRYDVFVGQAGAVALMHRLSPALADALVARASRSR